MMTFKRFLSLIMAAAMCLSVLPVQVFASDEAASNAVTGYDPETGRVTVAEVPAEAVTLILAGYAEERMVFALPQDASGDSPVTWLVPAGITFDTLKVFFLDGNSAPAEDALQIWPAFTLSFFPNGDDVSNMPEAQTIFGGSIAEEPTVPEREGYAFMGWITQAEGTEKFDFSTEVTDNLSLYALWAQKSGEVNTVYAFDETHVQYDSTEYIHYVDNILLAFVDDALTDVEKDEIAAIVDGVVVGSLEEVSNLLQIRVAAASLTELNALAEQLMAHPKVQYATFDAPLGNFSTSSNYSYADTDSWGGGITWTEDAPAGKNWAWAAIHAQSAWKSFGAARKDVTVGIIDNGFSNTHNDLPNISVVNANQNNEEASHGTCVAGVIGAENDDIGVCGVAYGADLVCYDVTNAPNTYLAVLRACDELIANGASVVNMSMGYTLYDENEYAAYEPQYAAFDYDTYKQIIENEAAHTGLLAANHIASIIKCNSTAPLFVQIAGNGLGNHYKEPLDAALSGYFASCTSEITKEVEEVHGLDRGTIKSHILIVTSIENEYTETEDGRMYSLVSGACRGETVDICAPGKTVYTTANDRFFGVVLSAQDTHVLEGVDIYRTGFGGTSAAAPFVAGAAALVRSINPQLTTAEVREILLSETDAEGYSDSGDIAAGTYPMVDAYAAAKKAQELIKTGSIFGSAKDPENAGIPATVELYHEGTFVAVATCDENGYYSFDHLPYGTYTVYASHLGYLTSTGLSEYSIEVDLESDLFNLMFPFIKDGNFYIHSNGTNILESGRFAMANKAATASWTVTASHDWTVTASANDWLSVSTASGTAGETALTLSSLNGSNADRNVTLTFSMGENTYTVTVSQKAYAVRGTVTDGSEPISGASVVVWNSDFRSAAVTTGADGTFSLSVPDGSYSVTVTAEGYEETTVAVPTPVNLCDASVSVSLSASNRCGDGLTWLLDETGLLTISGTGAMYNFVDTNPPWYEQRYSIRKLQVEEGVTTLGHYAFKECGSLAEVSLPSTLTSIGNGAFSSCYGLKTFPIPAGLTSIGYNAFYRCGNLSAFQTDEQNQRFETVDGVLFHKGLTTLIKYPGGKRFDFSGADASYEIPDGVQTVCAGALEGVMGSQYTDADGTVTYTGIQQLYFPASVTDIPWNDFNGTYNSYYIPHLFFAGVAPTGNGGYSYGQEAAAVIHFYKDQTADFLGNIGRNGWTSPLWISPNGDVYQTVCEDAQVTVSGKVTDVNGTPLEGVKVGLLDTEGKALPVYCVTDADGAYAFQLGEACSAVLKLQADGYGLTTVDVLLSKGENTLDTVVLTKTELIAEGTYYSAAWKLDTNGVLTVSGYGSINCDAWQDYQAQVTEICIESGITRVTLNPWGDDILRSIRVSDTVTSLNIYVGSYLETFTEILVDENNPTYTAVDGVLYSKDGKTLICYPCGKPAAVFTVPEGVTALGDEAFVDCANLQTVTFPASLTTLGTGVFIGCNKLSALEVASGSQTFASQDGVLFSKDMTVLILYPPAKSSASYVIPDSVTTLQDGIDSDSLKSVTLGASLTDLGDGISSSNLTTITVSSENTAFAVQDGVLFSKDMTTLICYPRGKSGDTYTVPDTVTALASNSLYYTPLKTVILPAGLDTIGAWALAAYHLENVYFYGPVPSVWEKYAFGFPQSKLFLNYIEGTNGWTSPTWTDPHGTVFRTVTFTP